MDSTFQRPFFRRIFCLLLLQFRLLAETETIRPTVDAVFPEPGAIHHLAFVEIHFSESVTGLDAKDLLANGVPCLDVRQVAAEIYVFTLPALIFGEVRLTWNQANQIQDKADVPNSFKDRNAADYFLLPPPRPSGVIISEIMATNEKSLRDEDGDYADWIELQNISGEDIQLTGWHLTDDPAIPSKWTFPEVLLPSRGYLVVFASAKDRSSPTNRLHTNFKLANSGEYLALTAPDGVIVNGFLPRYPAVPPNIAYGRANGDPDHAGYFATPTPGSANSISGVGFASEVLFSALGGFIPNPRLNITLALTLAAPATNTLIRYSIDGRIPTLTEGLTYLSPLLLVTTNAIMVRARAFKTDLLPGPIHTEYYTPLFVSTNRAGLPLPPVLNTNIQQFRSDLPLLVINTFGRTLNESANTVVNFTLFEPKDGVTMVTRPPDFTTRGSMKIRGSSSASEAKKQYAIQWTDDYNLDRELPVLGMPEESEWVLYAPNSFEPVSIHNPFIHQLARDIGEYSPRTRFVEVFINRVGPLITNHYEGLYVLMEKPGTGRKRIPGPKMQPEDSTLPDISGPYIMKIDRLDPGDSGVTMGGMIAAMVVPKEKEIKTTQRAAQRAYIVNYVSSMSRGFLSINRRNPTNTYENFIEMGRSIDFHILEMLSGNVDTLVLSSFFYKTRDQKLIFGPHWDFDRALGSTDGRDTNPRIWACGPIFAGWFGLMFQDIEAWQRWVDRFQELRTRQLSTPSTYQLMDRLANEIRQAEKRDFQRWKIVRRGGSYQAELESMKRWVSNRLDFVDRQLTQPPVPLLPSSIVDPGTQITLNLAPSSTASAVIWYTLDGTDPRALGLTNRSASARRYTGPITLDQSSRLVARSFDSSRRQSSGPPTSTSWSGPVFRTYRTTPPSLTLTEIHFHPIDADGSAKSNPEDYEFLELKNTSGSSLDLAGFKLQGEIQFDFATASFQRFLLPNARIVIASNTNQFVARYGRQAGLAGEFTGHLNDDLGRLILTDKKGLPIFDFNYSDLWVKPSDGDGFSMVIRSEILQAFDLDNPEAWRGSASLHGSPGVADLASDVGPDTDSDNDGLPDVWERNHFGTLNFRGDQDNDGDGASNRAEFLAGTLPSSADSRLLLSAAPSPFGGNPVLSFPRTGARSYTVSYRDSLASTNVPPWRELIRFPSQSAKVIEQFRDLTMTNAFRFYQVSTP